MTKTRTQRRLEKRQAIILLVLVLVASLASFVVGVMVGRRGAEREFTAQLKDQQEAVRVVQVPATAQPPAAAPASAAAVSRDPAVETVIEAARLSFYDDLVRDSLPLGSGINEAPPAKVEPQSEVTPPLDLADGPITVRTSAPAVAAASPAAQAQVQQAAPAAAEEVPETIPAAAAQGTHAVQIGSFAALGDAAALRKTMQDKGYPAFLAEADLAERGIWYRVRIGPYASADTAGTVARMLLEKEKIEGFVTRQTP
ncbi:MAG: SPOR domain-containing protein [Pelovirga sp.]